jgi:hypothetical protein
VPINIVEKDFLPPIAPAHYVRDRAGIVNAHLSRHFGVEMDVSIL